jgi:hypothetical protein
VGAIDAGLDADALAAATNRAISHGVSYLARGGFAPPRGRRHHPAASGPDESPGLLARLRAERAGAWAEAVEAASWAKRTDRRT